MSKNNGMEDKNRNILQRGRESMKVLSRVMGQDSELNNILCVEPLQNFIESKFVTVNYGKKVNCTNRSSLQSLLTVQ